MSFLVSPGVHVREIDLTNVVPSVQTTIGAIASAFEKGPVSSVVSVSSEEELVALFGKPKVQVISSKIGFLLQISCSIQTILKLFAVNQQL